mmetsp:Transcript_21934/g.56144  ORF Transcript_21934/g.56144 Transcript_21934/m.56144 type:complete len:115 (-) Transcript_21934:181-525(-)
MSCPFDVLNVDMPVRKVVPCLPGGKGMSLRFGVNTEGSPDALTTSHLSLQYADLTPDPTSTLAKNVPLHTPVVCCVQVESQLPFGVQLVISGSAPFAKKLWQVDAEYLVPPKVV